MALKNYTQIEKLLKLIGEDFVSSHNPNTRKGALVGLAAIAIALNKVSNLATVSITFSMTNNFKNQIGIYQSYFSLSLHFTGNRQVHQ